MAKGKSIAAVWTCQECGQINGVMRVMKEKIKELERKKYCPTSRTRTVHKAKLVKKGGTKAMG